MRDIINCMTLNVGGLLNLIKHRRLAKLIIKKQMSVICIQETHLKHGENKYLREIFRDSI